METERSNFMFPDTHRIDEAKYKSLLKYIRLNVTEQYDFPQEIVQIDGVTIATLGNFSASTGKPKSKKDLQCKRHSRIGAFRKRGIEIQS